MKQTGVAFIDKNLEKNFNDLKKKQIAENNLVKFLERAIEDLKQNPFAGIQIRKKLISKEYKQKGIQNLWKYNLPNAWRLIYTIQNDEVSILCVLLEWLDHKKYERRFRF